MSNFQPIRSRHVLSLANGCTRIADNFVTTLNKIYIFLYLFIGFLFFLRRKWTAYLFLFMYQLTLVLLLICPLNEDKITS